MKKISVILVSLFLMTACTTNTGTVNEKNAPEGMEKNNQKQAMEQIDKVNNKSSNANSSNTKKTSNMQNHKNLITEYTQAVIKTNKGDIKVKFYGEDSPKTVNNFMNLAQEGFYDNTKFHRVIKDFMIQGGDPNSADDAKKAMWGMGDPGYKFEDEFNSHKLVKGSLAMANSGPNTNGSQFFIVTTEATPWLDGKHTNFGEVVEGMDVVEAIEGTATGARDVPTEDMIVLGVELVK